MLAHPRSATLLIAGAVLCAALATGLRQSFDVAPLPVMAIVGKTTVSASALSHDAAVIG